jgi:cytochrome c oxidase subunit II
LHPGRPSNRARAALLLAFAALLILAPTALADYVTPESGGSPNADDIDTLYKITLAIGIVVFLIVESTLIWSLVRYRFRRGGPEPEQIRGNTPLEIGWTVGAALILVVLTAVTFVFLDGIKNPAKTGTDGLQFANVGQPQAPDGKSLEIQVNGQQYLWRYDYPGKEIYSYYEMVVPINTTVTLDVTSSDVQHSWWVPKLGGKADAVPGHVNQTWFKISKPGLYKGQCAELCGDNHADMRNVVRAVTPEEYLAFIAKQKKDIKASQKALSEQRKMREQQ